MPHSNRRPLATIRKPAFAGSFYPARQTEIKKFIRQQLDQIEVHLPVYPELVERARPSFLRRKISAVIVPHAGWLYSGPTALAAYRLLASKYRHRFILLGPSHSQLFPGVVQDDHSAWQTPLGLTPTKLLPKNSCLINDSRLHLREHSLEVQLPFLQYFVKELTLSPLLTSLSTDFQELASFLQSHLSRQTVLVVSSDLSHYLPEATARQVDQSTLQQILALDSQELAKDLYPACGKTGILTLLTLAQIFNWQPQLLYYDTSAGASGDYHRVVGYASLAFLSP